MTTPAIVPIVSELTPLAIEGITALIKYIKGGKKPAVLKQLPAVLQSEIAILRASHRIAMKGKS
jgi:hypothetical protein